MADLTAQIEISADASGVEAGVNRAKRSVESLGGAVADAGQKATTGLSGIGSSGEKAADQLDRSTKSMIASIQRATAMTSAGQSGTVKYFETLAQQRSVSGDALKPYLDQLQTAINLQNQAAASANGVGMSAKATAAALRGVPAQMTDIIVSLQSGQKPLTVLLQQGGQLKDMFGGVGNAAQAIGSYVGSLITPVNLAIAAAGGLAYVFYRGSEEAKELAKSIILTGNAANTTVDSLYASANSIKTVTGATKGAVLEALSQAVSSGKVTAQNLDLVATAAINLERATGSGIEETVKHFAELGKSPVEASLKLNEQYNYLTASIYTQIKALQDEGKTIEAASLAQRAFAEATNSMSLQVKQQLGVVERGWMAIKDAIKGAWDATLNIGRPATATDQISGLESKIKLAQEALANPRVRNTRAESGIQAQIDDMQRQRDALVAQRDADNDQVKREGAERAGEKASIEFLQIQEKYLTKEEQLRREIASIRNKGAAALTGELERIRSASLVGFGMDQSVVNSQIEQAKLRSEKTINNLVAEAKKRHEEKPGNDLAQQYSAEISAAKDAAKTQVEITKERIERQEVSEEEGLKSILQIQLEGYKKQHDLLAEQMAKTKDVGDRAKIGSQLKALANDAEKAQEQYVTALAKIEEARHRLMNSALTSKYNEVSKIDTENAGLREQLDTLGMSAEKLGEYERAKLNAAAAAELLTAKNYREAASIEETNNGLTESVKYLRDLADAAQQAGEALTTKGQLQYEIGLRKKMIQAAEEASKWAEKIGDSVTYALMRGFEAGKSYGRNLRDALVNMFKTMVVQPVIKVGVVTGLNAVGLGSAYASDLSTLKNVGSAANGTFNLLNGGYNAAYTSLATSSAGQWLGLSSTSTIPGYTAAEVSGMIGGVQGSIVAGQAPTLTSLGSTIGAAMPYIAAAAAAYMLVSSVMKSGGGPKTEGDYFGTLDASGKLTKQNTATGGDGVWYTRDVADAQMEQLAPAIGKAVYETVKALGGSTAGIGIDYGYNTDPKGKAPDNISAGVTNAAGEYVYRQTYNVDRGGASAALQTEMQRITLAAIKAADGIKPIFKELVAGIDVTTASADALSKVLSDVTYIKSVESAFDKLNLKADDLSLTLISAAGGAQTLASSLDSYYQNFFTEEERARKLSEDTAKAFADVGLSMPATKEAFRALVEGLDLTTASGQTTFAALMRLSPAFAQVSDALSATVSTTLSSISTLAGGQLSSAFGALSKTIAAEKTALQKSYDSAVSAINTQLAKANDNISKMTSLSGALKSTLSGLSILGSEETSRRAAQAKIESALVIARAGGPLPLGDELTQALQDVAKPSEAMFDSFVDYARDFYKTANTIADLSNITDASLTVEERIKNTLEDQSATLKSQFDAQVAYYDQMLASAQEQIDAVNGIDNTVKSLAQVLADLATAINTANGVKTATGTKTGTAGATLNDIVKAYQTELGRDPDKQGLADWKRAADQGMTAAQITDAIKASSENKIQDLYVTILGRQPDSGGLTDWMAALNSGMSVEDIASAFKASDEYKKIRGYAAGGIHGGGYRIVGEHGPELEYTPPSRIYSSPQTKELFDVAGMIAEIKLLREEVRRGQAQIAANTQQAAEALDGRGGPILVEIAE